MKTNLIILFLIFFFNCSATDYYFSAAGSNSNAGTSTGAPFQTLAKITSLTLAPGDHLYLRKGDSFLGGVTLLQSGSSGNPIVFDAYGSGVKPIVTGFANVSSWSLVSTGIYKVASTSLLTTCNMVLRDGIVQQIGRYPNTGYVTINSHTGGTGTGVSTTITAASTLPVFSGNMDIAYKPIQHIIDIAATTGQTSTSVTFPQKTSYNITNGYGFFIQNNIGMLDQLGEFYYDGTTKELNMYWGATSRTAVDVSAVSTLMTATSRSYITFQNLAFTGANADAFLLSSSNHITIDNCDISNCGGSGIEAANATDIKVTNSTVDWTLDNGIRLNQGANNVTSNDTVSNCTVTNISLKPGMGRSGDVKGMGIAVYGSNSYVYRNTLRNIGYCPVYYVWGNNMVVKNNVIDSFCLTKNDGGAIYTYNNGTSPINYTGQQIRGNICTNSIGSPEGTSSTSTAAYGIYLDINSSGITIDSNTCYNVERGLFNLGGWGCEVRDNTFYANSTDAIDVYYGSATWPHQITGFNIKKNILFSNNSTSLTGKYRTILTALAFGSIDSNYLCRPLSEPNGYNSTSAGAGGVIYAQNSGGTKYYSLDVWKTIAPLYDVHSSKTAIQVSSASKIRFEYNPTATPVNVSLGTTYKGVDGTNYSGTISIPAYSSLILLNSSTATDYYFSSSTGNDLTGDGSQGNPYASITKLNSLSLPAGAVCYLKRGDTFTGTITPASSGTAALPIVIDAYGTGVNPVVTQMTTLSTWTPVGGNIWESAAITTSIVPNVVTVNDEMVGKGRYPNDNAANGGYLTVSTGGSTSVTVLTLPTTINYTGGEAVMRTTHYQLDRNTITNHNTTSHILTYTNSTGLSMPVNFGLFIQNHVSTLDKQNEWYYNPSTKKLRIYSTTNPGSTVKVATGNNLFVANPRSYITVQNITFNGCNEQGISLKGGTDIIIQNCKVKNIGMDGFVLSGAKRATILNDTITNIANRAIRDSASSHRTIIKNNYIRNNAYIAGLQKTNANNFNAISLDATNDTVLVQGNTIINSGGGGINFRSSDSLWIKNNLIDTFAFVIDDIGAIYGYLGGSTAEAPGALKTKRIRGNIVRNGIGAGLGTPSTGAFFNSAYGMYWDNTIGNIYADSNHVHQGGRAAAYYHVLAHHITMKDNTLDSTQYLLYVLRDGTQDITNNVFQRNILFSRGTQKAIFFANFASTARATFGSIDSNHIAYLNTNTTPFSIQSTAGTTNYTFQNWKPIFDAHSDTFQTVSTSTIREDYSTAASNILNLGSYNWLDAKHTFYPKGTYTLNPWKGSVLVRWTLTGLTPPTCVITTPINGQGFTTPGNVTIVASATDNDGVITQVQFFQDGVPINTDLSSPYSFNVTGLAAGTYTFTAAATDNDGLITTSNPVTITVSNPLPVVTITSPPNGQTYTAPATVVLAASASIATGTITRVDFFRNGVFIGTDASSPYTVTQSGVTTGGWCYTAVAVSSYGDSTTSTSVCVQVSAANIPPTISITSPPTNSTYTAPATINFSASAGDADGTITRVNFYNGTTFIGTDNSTPYTFTWTGVTAGTYTIRATAKDNSGDSTTSAPITVIVNNPANVLPVVTITSPIGGASFYSPGAFTLTGTATDADGTITTTKLYQDGVLVGTDASSPYSFNISGLVAGGYVFIFTGIDNSGDSASALVNITVVDSVSNPPDTIPPLLINAVINNPILCAGGQATVTVSATGGEEPYSGDIGVHLETAGIKTYIVNDAAGNADTLVLAINEPGVLSATATLAPIQKYKGFGTVVINAIGGTGPYQYSIDGGTTWQTSNTFKLKAGNYTVIVKDANGCTTSVSFSLTQPKPGSNYIIHSATTYINL